jgi:subtilase family serine protease
MNQPGIEKKAATMRRLYAALGSVPLLLILGIPAAAQSVLTHHVREEVTSGKARFLNRLPATQTLRVDVVLPLRDPAGLEKFLQDVYNPSSPSYRHFLTVPEFTARFGPTQEDYDAVVRYATTAGLAVAGGSRDGMDVQMEGSISNLEAAFHVSMGVYQHPTQNRTFYAPDREPSVDLSVKLWHVSGLDNYSIPHPQYHRRDPDARRTPAPQIVGSGGSCPEGSFCGSDMRAAYYGGTTLTGTGQNIGLLEYYGYDIADVNTYYTNAGQTNLSSKITGISTDGTSLSCFDTTSGHHLGGGTTPACDDTEQTIDITQALGMAPGINTLYVFVGSSDTALFSSMTTHSPLPLQLSSSWTWTPVDPNTDDPYFEKMAAQGQSYFQASGDSSAWSTGNDLYPSEDPHVICVGGTDLITSSPGGSWSSELAWPYSGGGISPDNFPIPAWQLLTGVITANNDGSKSYRNGPDVSANADFSFYVCADQTTCSANLYGGTSFAAPMWAAYTALANQQSATNSGPAIGFINPAVYAIGVSANYDTDFHDITSGNNDYTAVTGYDLVTGWGSPNGANLINALAATGPPPAPSFSLGATAVSVAQSSSGESTVTSTISNGFSGVISLAASGQPIGVTAAFVPTSITGAGTSTLTLTVGSTVTPGPYTITVTGTSGIIVQTTTLTLTVTPAQVGSFTITPSVNAISVSPGRSGSATITTAVTGGFNSAIALTATGQPGGVSLSFSSTSIAAPGSGTSTLTFHVNPLGIRPGTYTITITGKGGNQTESTTISLTI